MIKVQWKNIKIGDIFEDGSKITQIHEISELPCYKLTYKKAFSLKKSSIVISGDHLFLCNISLLNEKWKSFLLEVLQNVGIPKSTNFKITTTEDLTPEIISNIVDYIINGTDENVDFEIVKNILDKADVSYEDVEAHPAIIDNNNVWLTAEAIHHLINNNQIIKIGENIIKDSFYYGIKKCRCISTDSGKYVSDGLIHHNSVTIRNIIFHCLTHSEDISIGLVDLKLTEFTPFKGMRGVVGVANTVPETVELLRVAREVMYHRNAEMAKLGLTDFTDFEPQEPTDKISICGRHFKEDQIFEVIVDGENKKMTAKEVLEYLNS